MPDGLVDVIVDHGLVKPPLGAPRLQSTVAAPDAVGGETGRNPKAIQVVSSSPQVPQHNLAIGFLRRASRSALVGERLPVWGGCDRIRIEDQRGPRQPC